MHYWFLLNWEKIYCKKKPTTIFNWNVNEQTERPKIEKEKENKCTIDAHFIYMVSILSDRCAWYIHDISNPVFGVRARVRARAPLKIRIT